MNKSIFRRLDPRYNPPRRRLPHKSWAKSAQYRAHDLNSLRKTDHRTPQEVERQQFGAFYPFICAARAEDQNTRHVAKAQAAMRWHKSKSK
jgi:hypothetical protein